MCLSEEVKRKMGEVYSLTANFKLTPNQRRILSVNVIPHCEKMTNLQKAEYAEVSEKTYYNTIALDKYKTALCTVCRHLFSTAAGKLTLKYIKLAENGDLTALQNLLRQIGILDNEKNVVENTTPQSINIVNYSNLSDDDRQKLNGNVSAYASRL